MSNPDVHATGEKINRLAGGLLFLGGLGPWPLSLPLKYPTLTIASCNACSL